MSNTEAEKKENTGASQSSVDQPQEAEQEPQETATTVPKVFKKTIPFGKPGPKCRKMLLEPTNESKLSGAADGEKGVSKKTSASNDVPREMEKMFGDLAKTPEKKENAQATDGKTPTKVTTDNLLSMLEDSIGEKKTPSSTENPEAAKIPSKRYVYKLKSKSGKILKYTSNMPIVLKKPFINLIKMEGTDEETDGAESDNSAKENMKENEASSEPVVSVVRKRGRPPLSQKTPSTVKTDELHPSDTTGDSKDRTPAFGMQTRKRQLRFLPDGRVLTPTKKGKTDEKKSDIETASSSDSDIQTASDDDSDRGHKKPGPAKNLCPEKKQPVASAIPDKKMPIGKTKKIFDFENYFKEKTGQSPTKESKEPSKDKPASTAVTTIQNKTSTEETKIKSADTASVLQQSSIAGHKKVTPVDPAQLLSSLIGVPITPSQLNIVKFKPRIIQERSSTAPQPKKVTIDDERLKKMVPGNTPYKVVSKTTFQKILPKPSPMDRTPIIRRVMEHRIVPATPTGTYTAIAPKITPEHAMNDTLSKFDNFTDSKVVKTKGGPKKVLKHKSMEDDSPKTVYDLLQHVFDQMPSWNLHVIPDTNHFCIAQVSRGRMGIPILKKSIELNAEFFAKVYVHQLHCKRYDGIYDTESKILSLIREIDALAA